MDRSLPAANQNSVAPLVQVAGISKRYDRGAESVFALQNASLTFACGDFLAFMGPSGSGKTTLLNVIGGLDEPTSGTVLVDGVDIYKLSDSRRSQWRASSVGFVFQLYHLHPAFNAEQNVILPLRLVRMRAAERRRRARIALEVVGLADRATHKPSQLSGGQQQRVAIARALVTDPALMLCDEPTGNLDKQATRDILDLLKHLNESQGKTIVMVTHDPHAASYAQRTLTVDKGVLSTVSEQ
jgi:putative ABC transport system ATP-binding protein